MYRIIFILFFIKTQAIIPLIQIQNANWVLNMAQISNQYTNLSNITCEQCLCRMLEMNNLTTSIVCQPNQMTCQILLWIATPSLKIDTSSVVYMKPMPTFLQTTTSDQPVPTSISSQSLTSTSTSHTTRWPITSIAYTTRSPITSSRTSSMTSTSTTPIPLVDLTRIGDTIVGLYNTTAGRSTGSSNGRYSNFTEVPRCAIDRNLTTKYLNFGGTGCSGCFGIQPGKGTGFFILPSISNRTVARALLFATGNDVANRDPITVTLEGSNATTNATLHLGSSWKLIYNGSTGINPLTDPGRSVYVTQQNFSNTLVFASYRLLVTSQRGDDTSVQYSEAHILGYY